MRGWLGAVLAASLLACGFDSSPLSPGTPAVTDRDGLGRSDAGVELDAASPRCREGDRRSCYDGPEATRGTGACLAGVQSCEQGRWSACRGAVVPGRDLCDGKDNDCDGAMDEDDPSENRTCDSGGDGRCAGGVVRCRDGALACVRAFAPGPEECDGEDDDCDGRSDEDFRSGDGLYVDDAHCGACGQACGDTIDGSASERCDASGGVARCEVEACRPGFIRVAAQRCERAVPDPCARCLTDADCANPGDACVQLFAERGCGIDCGEDNVYGATPGSCPDGYRCAQQPDGPPQCVPESNSCSCLPDDDDAQRQCVVSNAHGACAGHQRCEAGGGWSACDAPSPLAESCNGGDDDCDGLVDEGDPGGGATCITGLPGICGAGRLACSDGELRCHAQMEPSEEQCGNQRDDDCDGYSDEDCCPHSECVIGAPLPLLCSSCSVIVCSQDPFCCDEGPQGRWDTQCVKQAALLCGLPCEVEQ